MMRMRTAVFGAAAVAALLAGGVQAQSPAAKPAYGTWGYDAKGGDTSVKPGDDYFAFANGRWDKSTPIPADKPGAGVGWDVNDEAERQVRTILETPPTPGAGAEAEDAAKVHAFYAAFMDKAHVDALGAKPIAPDLAAIRAAKTRAALARLMGRSSAGFQPSIMAFDIEPDAKDPKRYAVDIGQGGLGLPDRDYYLTPQFKTKLAAYEVYVADMLRLAGWAQPEASAKAVVAYETAIAKVSWALADRRDPDKLYNPMTPRELAAYAPGFPWTPFLAAASLSGAKRVIVGEKTAVKAEAAIFAATPLATLRAWAAFHVLESAGPYLSQPFVDRRFAFRGTVLNGQLAQRPRWKRAVNAVDGGMGEAVGRVYVAEHFPPESKAKIDALVGELKVALGKRIDALEWMSPATKARAHEKLARFTVKIAYPDRWRDYSKLAVSPTDLVGDVAASEAFEWRRQLARIDGPVDRSEWGMTPQTVNAYYNPTLNEIVFPAAILQPPYFDAHADAASNYGAIGAVIGHEMTHGFDDEGRKFDGAGVLTDWWTPEDGKKFDAKTAALAGQYDGFSPYAGAHVNGKLTNGENIADLGGVLIALDAYHASLNGQPAPVIDGLTGDQRFFLAYGQAWREKSREDAERAQLVSDPHSPAKYRVNGVVRNVDAWYAAEGVKPGDANYLAPDKRVRIW